MGRPGCHQGLRRWRRRAHWIWPGTGGCQIWRLAERCEPGGRSHNIILGGEHRSLQSWVWGCGWCRTDAALPQVLPSEWEHPRMCGCSAILHFDFQFARLWSRRWQRMGHSYALLRNMWLSQSCRWELTCSGVSIWFRQSMPSVWKLPGAATEWCLSGEKCLQSSAICPLGAVDWGSDIVWKSVCDFGRKAGGTIDRSSHVGSWLRLPGQPQCTKHLLGKLFQVEQLLRMGLQDAGGFLSPQLRMFRSDSGFVLPPAFRLFLWWTGSRALSYLESTALLPGSQSLSWRCPYHDFYFHWPDWDGRTLCASSASIGQQPSVLFGCSKSCCSTWLGT